MFRTIISLVITLLMPYNLGNTDGESNNYLDKYSDLECIETGYVTASDLDMVINDMSDGSYRYTRNNTPNAITVLENIMNANNLQEYSIALWGDGDRYNESNPWRVIKAHVNTLDSAENYGLLDGIGNINWTKEMGKDDFLLILSNLYTSTELNNIPSIVQTIQVNFEDYTTNSINYTYEAIMDIPDEIMDKLIESGWEISVVDNISEIKPSYSSYTNASGLTDPNTKEIYIEKSGFSVSGNTVRHEIGHAWGFEINTGDIPYTIYNKEKEQIEDSLRSYSASSPGEAYADIFAYCCKWLESQEKLNELREEIPDSFDYVMSTSIVPYLD